MNEEESYTKVKEVQRQYDEGAITYQEFANWCINHWMEFMYPIDAGVTKCN